MSKPPVAYDDSSINSILDHALLLLDRSLSDVMESDLEVSFKGKGSFGQKVEKLYFGYEPNSRPEADFPKVGMELKTTPLKETTKGLVSKERLVFNTIDYKNIYKETFSTSTFWKKNQLLLLMFYLYEQGKIDFEYIFKIIRIWQFPSTDLKIIKDDWELIVNKIRSGRAHELSEGDTVYLGACTKGANKESVVDQPFSEQKAMKRAFSLKSKYLNFIIEKSLKNEDLIIDYSEYDRILNENNAVGEPRAEYRKINIQDLEPIVKSIDEYGPGETFEDLVTKKFRPFINLTESQIAEKVNFKATKAKNRLHLLGKAILGVSKNKIEEFEKADIQMKTIKLEQGGSLKESMSFAQVQFKEIVNEIWEDSYWYETLTKRFFFVIFQRNSMNELVFRKVMFWTMPNEDLEIAKLFWLDTKNKIVNGDFNHFIKISDRRICHIRPKGKDSTDLMETVSGTREKKKSYWLNGSYIKEIIK